MSRKVLIVPGMVILLAWLTSCAPAISPDGYNALEQEHSVLKQEYNALKQEYSVLETKLNNAQHEVNKLTTDLATVRASYASIMEEIKQSTLRNPSWAELETFLELDDTDRLTYDENNFDCDGFAITLRDRAWRYGLRSSYVQVEFVSEAIGHSLNAFQTTERGVVYVDDAESDRIAYVQIGKPYGTIAVNRVKSEYIVCQEDPAKFWEPLTKATHPNPLSYDYYEGYLKRSKFLSEYGCL